MRSREMTQAEFDAQVSRLRDFAVQAVRVVPLDEVRRHGWYYTALADLSEIFNHRIVVYEDGRFAWERNPLMRLMADRVSLNDVGALHAKGLFTDEQMMKFHMQIGYSLLGFLELWTPYGMHEEDTVAVMLARHRGTVISV